MDKINKILIVEDSKLFILVMRELLNRSGYEIFEAEDGNEALKITTSDPPDLILMDLYMKGLDGDKCCRHIKSNPVTEEIPVIMVTSAGKEEDIEKCKDAGCDDYITKPIDKMSLLNKVKQFLDIPTREYKRAPICTPVLYYFNSQQYKGTIYGISERGMFIKGEKKLEKGSTIKVHFDIADFAREIEIIGEVVWNTDERTQLPSGSAPGFGVRFISIGNKGMEDIKRYIYLGNYLV